MAKLADVQEPLKGDAPNYKRRQYPWDEWLDGHVWELEQGDDFTVDVKSFRATAAGAAVRSGLKVTIRELPGEPNTPTRIHLQARPKGTR